MRKRVAEIHSTAPVVEEMKKNRKLCLSLKRRANCKIAGYVPGKFRLLTKVCRMRRDKVRQVSPFSPSPHLLQRNTNTSSGWVASCCLVDFCFTLTSAFCHRQTAPGCLDESAYRTFHHFIAFRVNHTDFTCLTMRT